MQVGGGWAQRQSLSRRTSKLLLSEDSVTWGLFSPAANSVTSWTTNIPRQECESFPAQTQQAGEADVRTLLIPACPLCLFWDVRVQGTHSGPARHSELVSALLVEHTRQFGCWQWHSSGSWWECGRAILMRFKPIDFNYLVKSLHLLPFSPTLSRRSRPEAGLKPKSPESQASNSVGHSLQMLLDPDPSYVL